MRTSRKVAVVLSAFAGGFALVALVSLQRYTDTRTAATWVLAVVFAGIVAAAAASAPAMWRGVSVRVRAMAVAAAVSPMVLFAVGSSSQLEIDSTPVLSSSDRAGQARTALGLEADLRLVASTDELFALDMAGARAELESFEIAANTCGDVVMFWSDRQVDQIFDPAVQALMSTADMCVRAAGAYVDAVETGDERVIAEAVNLRDNFISEALRAGRELSAAAQTADVPLRATSVTE